MDKIVYTSTKAQLDPSRYAVGYVSCNELHLNPLHSILHVKPTFQYLDKSDKNLKTEHKDADSGCNLILTFHEGYFEENNTKKLISGHRIR